MTRGMGASRAGVLSWDMDLQGEGAYCGQVTVYEATVYARGMGLWLIRI